MEPIVRSSGVLAPLFSLPGVRDMGALGRCARNFVDFLAASGQRWFQTLPISPVDEFGSPYAGRSAFAGETLYLDLEEFRDEGLLDDPDLADAWFLPDVVRPGDSSTPQQDARSERIDYRAAFARRRPCWEKAFKRYREGRGGEKYRREEERFRQENAYWLDDYALFQTAADEFGDYDWAKWSDPIKRRDPDALKEFAKERVDRLDFLRFLQLAFDVQWREFHDYCAKRGVRLFGDVPIYVGRTSADVWARPELFQIDAEGRTIREAGVPADDFNPDGQRWNSPLYRWDVHRANDFEWHRKRMQKTIARFDVVRLDHFIGFYNYYSFPGDGVDPTSGQVGGAPVVARQDDGRVYEKGWEPGPQEAYFDAIFQDCPAEAFVAEDLGVMNQGVCDLRDRYALPGMQVFQFSFDGVKLDPKTKVARDPTRNWSENYVAYTGTHDAAPILGWLDDVRKYGGRAWTSLDFNAIASALAPYRRANDPPVDFPTRPRRPAFVERLARLFGGAERPKMGVSTEFRPTSQEVADLRFAVLRAVASSRCKLAIFPLQDVLSLSNDARINFPGVGVGNWSWRLADGLLTDELAQTLRAIAEESGRV